MFGAPMHRAKVKWEKPLVLYVATVICTILTVALADDDVIVRSQRASPLKQQRAMVNTILRSLTKQRNNQQSTNLDVNKFVRHDGITSLASFKKSGQRITKRSVLNLTAIRDYTTDVKIDGTANRCVLRKPSTVVYECRPIRVDMEQAGANFTDFSPWTHDLTAITDASSQWKVPPGVTDLRLWKQGITAIYKNAFTKLGDTLISLHLEHNAITYVSQMAFAGLHRMDELHMSHNRLQTLPSCVFAGLSSLSFLSLQHNEIEVVRRRTLGGLTSLAYLDLSSNNLEEVHNDAFQMFQGRRSIAIDLRKNRLTQPRKGWLTAGARGRGLCQTAAVRNRPLAQQPTASANNISLENATRTTPNPPLLPHERFGRNHSRQQRHIFTRILWASGNPWNCGCGQSSETFDFLHAAIRLTSSNVLQTLNCSGNDGTLVALQKLGGFYSVWDIQMPCATPVELRGVNLGLLSKAVPSLIRSCCNDTLNFIDFSVQRREACDATKEWYRNLTVNCTTKSDKPAMGDSGLNDNEVTIIGIVIVVLIPVLLTLCPDCDRSVVPIQKSQSGVDVPSASQNMNNNVSNNIFRDSRSTYTVRTFADHTRIFSNYSSGGCYSVGCNLNV